MRELFRNAILKQQFTQLPNRQQLTHQHQKTEQRYDLLAFHGMCAIIQMIQLTGVMDVKFNRKRNPLISVIDYKCVTFV